MPKSQNLVEIAKKSENDQNDPKSPKTTKTTKATKQKILRPNDSENDQFGRKRPKMATLKLGKGSSNVYKFIQSLSKTEGSSIISFCFEVTHPIWFVMSAARHLVPMNNAIYQKDMAISELDFSYGTLTKALPWWQNGMYLQPFVIISS